MGQSRFRLCLLGVVVSGGVPATVFSQDVPTLRIVDSLRIEMRSHGLIGNPTIALRRDGVVAIHDNSQRIAAFDSLGRKRWIRNLRGEVWSFEGLQWRDDSLLIVDNNSDQLVAVGLNGGLGSSTELPSWIGPSWSNRQLHPKYAGFRVEAATRDGAFIGTGARPHRFGLYGPKADPDPSQLLVLRVNVDGIIERTVATIRRAQKEGDQWFFATDARVLIFRPAADSLTFISIAATGDTTFTRTIDRPQRPIAAAQSGPDGSTWVSVMTDKEVMTHTVFDARGRPMGKILLPTRLRVAGGDASHVWVYELKGDWKPLVRYTLR